MLRIEIKITWVPSNIQHQKLEVNQSHVCKIIIPISNLMKDQEDTMKKILTQVMQAQLTWKSIKMLKINVVRKQSKWMSILI